MKEKKTAPLLGLLGLGLGATLLAVRYGSKLFGPKREPAYKRNMWRRVPQQPMPGMRVGRVLNSARGER